ncbi:hypothetical protein BAC1_00169 [uncultured bacterium]|nr:hypothetical protein BAC1_00169 [uncultured bacterium]
MEDSKRYATAALFLSAVFVFLVYLPSLKGAFVNWDDQLYVFENSAIRSLDLHFLKAAFTEAMVANWHPLTMVSHALDYAFWGLSPAGHHLTNIILHSINTALVFLLCIRLFRAAFPKDRSVTGGRMVGALTAALLFGLHPLHVESVAWISERKDVLSGLFFLLSLVVYLEFARSDSKKALKYLSALLLFTLSILSKPMAVTTPFILLLIDFYPLRRFAAGYGKPLIEKVPFLAISAISGVLTMWAQGKGGAIAGDEAVPFMSRVGIAAQGIAAYIQKMLWPADLAVIYPLPKAEEVFGPAFFISLALIILVTAYSALKAKKNPVYLAVWAYFIITLLPVIGFIKVGAHFIADRYTYIPSIGPFLLAGIGAGMVFERFSSRRNVILAFLAVIFVLLTANTVRQERVWRDSFALWNHQIGLYPEDPQGYNHRGNAFERVNDMESAIADFNTAVRLDPFYSDALYNRGLMNQKRQNYEDALKDYNVVQKLKPELVNVYINRGISYLSIGRPGLALEDFKASVSREPENAHAYMYLGIAYAETGALDLASSNLKKASSLGLKEADEYLARIL